MKRMIFDKEETKNLIMMLKSEDVDNHIIAFQTLENVDIKKYIGELFVLFKFGGHKSDYWKENCLVMGHAICKLIGDNPDNLTSPRTLSLITEHKGSATSIELFMEFYVRDMTKMLGSIGYPIHKFEIDIKLKDNGQSNKS